MEELQLLIEKYWLTIGLGIISVLIFLVPQGRGSSKPHQRVNHQERTNKPKRENLEKKREKINLPKVEKKRSVAESINDKIEVTKNEKFTSPKTTQSKNNSQENLTVGEKWSQQIIQLVISFSTERENQLSNKYGWLRERIAGQTILSGSKKQLYLGGAFLFLLFTEAWVLAFFLFLGIIVLLSLSIHWIDLYEQGFAIRTFGVDQDHNYRDIFEVCFVTYRYTEGDRQELYATFVTNTGREIVEEANQYYKLMEKLTPLLKAQAISITFINYQDGKLI